MKYTYLVVKPEGHDPNRARLERMICGIKQSDIAEVIGCHTTAISRLEVKNRIGSGPVGDPYRRISRGIHNHVSNDYWPCPTLIKLAPEKWTDYKMALMAIYRKGIYDV